MDIKLKVGSRLREIRIKKKLSQEALSRVSGIDRTYISDVENGRRNISIETLEAILISLEISVKRFFCNSSFDLDS